MEILTKSLHLLLFFIGITNCLAQAVYNGSNKHTFYTNHGVIDIGPQNSYYAHIYTDRPKIIFNKDVYTTTNAFSSYNNDLIFKTEGTERMRINDDTGNVGIGTVSPKSPLHIANSLDAPLTLQSTDGTWLYTNWLDNTSTRRAYFGLNSDLNEFRLNVENGTNEIILNGGNVGIGTNSPDSKLTVKGNIHAEEVRVDLNVPGPDYVFKEDYDLKSLEEVQHHIKVHGHLPNIPSAQEMEANGIKVGDMNMKLLEKIEELTLYVIELNKNYLELKNENIELKRKIKKIVK